MVEEFVGRLTGKQTMYQMIELADQIAKRGGTPLDPLEYKKMYLDRAAREDSRTASRNCAQGGIAGKISGARRARAARSAARSAA